MPKINTRITDYRQTKSEPGAHFDISGVKYESIVNSLEIMTKVAPSIERILNSLL